MRRAKGHAYGQTRLYTPRADGNDKAEDPVQVEIQQPTEGQRRALRNAAVQINYVDGEMRSKPSDVDVRKTALEQHVIVVRNYVDASGKPILTGGDLWEHGESEFVYEVAQEILNDVSGLTEQEKKPSSEQPS